jgi:hypothetical protein
MVSDIDRFVRKICHQTLPYNLNNPHPELLTLSIASRTTNFLKPDISSTS